MPTISSTLPSTVPRHMQILINDLLAYSRAGSQEDPTLIRTDCGSILERSPGQSPRHRNRRSIAQP